jgi:hypothetical protein
VIVLVDPHRDEWTICWRGIERFNQIGVGKQTTL